MDERQIAFIICSNYELELEECKYYINQLKIPKDFTIDIIVVEGATSMAEGYQAAMKSSNAKYKVYLHHDTFIINKHFIHDVIRVFQQDNSIGLLGVIGASKMPNDAYACTSWNTGMVLHNISVKLLCGVQPEKGNVLDVDALDGLLLVTQYDINWREDLFQNWDYYDISQCYEFHRRELRVVIPYQSEPWCYHDSNYSRMGNYDRNRKIFVDEYQDVHKFIYKDSHTEIYEGIKLQEQFKQIIELLLNQGRMDEVCDIFNTDPAIMEYSCIRDYALTSLIYISEKKNLDNLLFYNNETNVANLLLKLNKLRHLLKRIEFGYDISNSLQKIIKEFSTYAIFYAIVFYVRFRKKMLLEIDTAYRRVHRNEEAQLIMRLREVINDDI